MRFRSTLAGLVVLAFLGAGVYWARVRPSASHSASAPGPSSQAAPPAAASARPGQDEAWADVTAADATVDDGDVRITFSVASRPAVALAKTRVRVRAESAGSSVTLADGRVSFEMTMPMGDHRYSLIPGADGWQEADVVLPLCRSGKRRWYATVEGTVAGRSRTARFRLDLVPPLSGR